MKNLNKKTSLNLIKDLPLLSFTANFFEHVNLENTLIICVQHLYPTTYNMFNNLFQMGLKPGNLHIIGKCYSTDPSVYNQLKNDGVNISSKSMYFDSFTPYDLDFETYMSDFFDDIINTVDFNKFEKIIILDDGGFLIQVANKKLPHTLNIVGIEQTSAGFNRVKKKDVFFPVINTARSWVKMKYESPIIIELALRKLTSKINHLDPQPKKILIMGFGTLGKIVHKSLKNKYDLSSFDMDKTKSMISHKDLKNVLNQYDLIIGATGETSLPQENFKSLKNPVVLASISSSDREFDSTYLRRKTQQTYNCHSDLNIDGITLLNCGFPINFDKDYSTIDTDNFQLTRSLILGAVCQAYKTSAQSKGFLELDDEFQTVLEKELQRENQA